MLAALRETERFRKGLEAAYSAMWDRAQRGEPAAGFAVDESRIPGYAP